MEKKVLKYTSLTPEDCYDICYKTTMENILKYDGRVDGENVIINYRKPDILPLEVAYPGIIVKEVNKIKKPLNEVNSIEFTGTGIAIVGPGRDIQKHEKQTGGEFVAEIEVKIDGESISDRTLRLKPGFEGILQVGKRKFCQASVI